MKELTAYRCDFCKKLYIRKSSCKKHENLCFLNPENKPACFGCKYLTKKLFYDDPNDENSRSIHTLYCKKKEVSLMPITSFKKGFLSKGEYADEVMPKECKMFDESEIDDYYL
ncbi:MAG: hypothetical protein WCS51_05550 [Bacilli bacterium]